jgi:hypothetical protein
MVDIEPLIIRVYDGKEPIMDKDDITFNGLIEFLKKYETYGLSS